MVFTLNRRRDSEVSHVVNGALKSSHTSTNASEVLVMVLWDGHSENAFEFHAFASYVSDQVLAGGFHSLGLPSKATPNLVYQLGADPDQLEPDAVVPFFISVPGAFEFSGTVVRPLAFGAGGLATHHFHGPRGTIWVEHDTPVGAFTNATGTVTVTGQQGAWLAQLLGTTSAPAAGFYLEKQVGHAHTAYLLD